MADDPPRCNRVLALQNVDVGSTDRGGCYAEQNIGGADLRDWPVLQLYSALVFRGLSLVAEIKEELLAALERGEARTLADLVGVDAADITAQPWPA